MKRVHPRQRALGLTPANHNLVNESRGKEVLAGYREGPPEKRKVRQEGDDASSATAVGVPSSLSVLPVGSVSSRRSPSPRKSHAHGDLHPHADRHVPAGRYPLTDRRLLALPAPTPYTKQLLVPGEEGPASTSQETWTGHLLYARPLLTF